jgi:hypothetical protein
VSGQENKKSKASSAHDTFHKWVKTLAIVIPLLGGGGYAGSQYLGDSDDEEEYNLQQVDAEDRSIRMEQDDKREADDQEIINMDEEQEPDDTDAEDTGDDD